MSEDLIRRLRSPANEFCLDPAAGNPVRNILREAADALEALQARVKELESFFEPYHKTAFQAHQRAAVAEAQVTALREALNKASTALGLYASVIKCGEPWTDDCQQALLDYHFAAESLKDHT